MKTKTKTNQSVLALYPSCYGLGYALFDSPDHLVAFGIGATYPIKSTKTLKRVKEYINYFKPDIIIMRRLAPWRIKVGKRMQEIIYLISNVAEEAGLKTHQYTREEIRGVFVNFGVETKFQITKKLLSWFPRLEKYAHPKRKEWMSEHHYAGVFDAVALGMTHFYTEK